MEAMLSGGSGRAAQCLATGSQHLSGGSQPNLLLTTLRSDLVAAGFVHLNLEKTGDHQ